jgi:hypothetical protein
MPPFIFRCPTTGWNVQGWLADDVSADDREIYEPVRCNACDGMHFINPTTRRVLGSDDE